MDRPIMDSTPPYPGLGFDAFHNDAKTWAHTSRSLQKIACSVVGDKSAAEDIVQNAWVEWLERGPSRLGIGWLRKLVQSRSIDAWRRNARENRRFGTEDIESLPQGRDALGDKLEIQRTVLEAVDALDEPYRTTVYLRYFEELGPRAMAKRLGVPEKTIKTRLTRAHQQLRGRLSERLQDETGCWVPAFLGFAEAPRFTSSVPLLVSTSALIMNKIALVAFAALAMIVGWVAYPQRDDIGPPAVVPRPVSAHESATVPAPEVPSEQASSSSRVDEHLPGTDAEPLEQLIQEDASPAARTMGVLTGIVTDDVGAMVRSGWVWTLRENGERLNARVNSDGRYRLEGIALGYRRIMAGASHLHDREVVILFDEANPYQEQDFRLDEKQRIRVRLMTSTGESTIGAMSRSSQSAMGWELVPVVTREDPGETFEEVSGSQNNPFGIGSFWQSGFNGRDPLTPDEYGTVTINEDGPAWLSLVAAHQVLRKSQVDPSTEVVIFEVDPGDLLALQAGVRGRLLDGETGEALSGNVYLGREPFAIGKPTPVDTDGGFLFEPTLPGLRYLVALAPERAELVLPVHIEAGSVLDLGDLTLHPSVHLSGRTIDQAGRPIKAELRWGRLDPDTGYVDWVRQRGAQSDEHGEFSLNGLDPGIWVVVAPGLPAQNPQPYDDSFASLPSRVDARDGSVADIELVLRPTGSLILVSTMQKDPWPHVRAYDERGLSVASAWIGRWNEETPMRLPPGVYELVIKRDGMVLERRSIAVGEKPQRLMFEFDSDSK